MQRREFLKYAALEAALFMVGCASPVSTSQQRQDRSTRPKLGDIPVRPASVCPPEELDRQQYLIRFTSELVALYPNEGDSFANYRIEPMRDEYPNSGRLIFIIRPGALGQADLPRRHIISEGRTGKTVVHWFTINQGTLYMVGGIGTSESFGIEQFTSDEAFRVVDANSSNRLKEMGIEFRWILRRNNYNPSFPIRMDYNWMSGAAGGLTFDGEIIKTGKFLTPNCSSGPPGI